MPQAVGIENHSSDPHLGDMRLAAESSGELEEVELPHGIGDDISIEAVKLPPTHHPKDHGNESSRRNSIHSEHATGNASVHSLPVAHVTNPEPTVHRRPSTARGSEFTIPSRSPTSMSRSHTPQEDLSVPQSNRRLRHRSGADVGSNVRQSNLNSLS